eukprot:Platyproteum_vivax@DN13903_c0_g1_i1.p1
MGAGNSYCAGNSPRKQPALGTPYNEDLHVPEAPDRTFFEKSKDWFASPNYNQYNYHLDDLNQAIGPLNPQIPLMPDHILKIKQAYAALEHFENRMTHQERLVVAYNNAVWPEERRRALQLKYKAVEKFLID